MTFTLQSFAVGIHDADRLATYFSSSCISDATAEHIFELMHSRMIFREYSHIQAGVRA